MLGGHVRLCQPLEGYSRVPGTRTRVGQDGQRVSLWRVCCRSQRQYFFISMRSRSLILFLTVM